MKKVYLFFIAVVFAISANAQMKVFNTGNVLIGGTSGTLYGNIQLNFGETGTNSGLCFFNKTYGQVALKMTTNDYQVFLVDPYNIGFGWFGGSLAIGHKNTMTELGGHLNVVQSGYDNYIGVAATSASSNGVAVYARNNSNSNTGRAFMAQAANNGIAFSCGSDTLTGFYIFGNGRAVTRGICVTSDSTMKTDIKSLETPLQKLLKLKGVSFAYKSQPEESSATKATEKEEIAEGVTDSIKHNTDKIKIPELNADIMDKIAEENKTKKHIGFLAQDVEKVFPDLVTTTIDGKKAVAYTELIAVLTESIKEQQTMIDEMKLQISDLESALVAATVQKTQSITANTEKVSENNLLEAKLFQNTPNPFTQDTEVAFSLPETVQKADLYIYDMNGAQITQIALAQRGNAAVTINGGKLAAGMYLYSLIADGKIIDTKRMILTK
jgi:hypothetical protein